MKIWFQNRRAKERKINKKRIQQTQNGQNDQDPLSPAPSLNHMMPLPGTNVGTLANAVAQWNWHLLLSYYQANARHSPLWTVSLFWGDWELTDWLWVALWRMDSDYRAPSWETTGALCGCLRHPYGRLKEHCVQEYRIHCLLQKLLLGMIFFKTMKVWDTDLKLWG